jgi:outer membrane lipoprotein SlyB
LCAPLLIPALSFDLLTSRPTFAQDKVVGQGNVAQNVRYGEVVSLRKVKYRDPTTGTGARVGATAGAVAGYALAGRGDRWVGGLLGGLVGGAAGGAIERAGKKKKGWELIIKIDGGEEIAINVPGKQKQYEQGNRVRLMTGPGGKTEVVKIEDEW